MLILFYCINFNRWYFPVLFNSDDDVLDLSSNPYLFSSCFSCQNSLYHNQTMEYGNTHNRSAHLTIHKCSRTWHCPFIRYQVWVCIFSTTFVSPYIKCVSVLCYVRSFNINIDIWVECDCSNCLDAIPGK